MRIGNYKIESFLDEVASKNPTPGGGAVAALTGAIAASLIEMVVNLTKGDPTSLNPPAGRAGLCGARAKILRVRLLGLADEDCKVFDAVVLAYRAKDKLKIKKALLGAIEIPEETKKLSKEVGELAKVVAKVGNKNAVSDAKTAVHLARAAAKSAEENIKINRTALKKLGS
ncbi:MAG: cyclodeaminase/cyclohydrolase family protein [bacterium]|nr:cyclodeaminase/cyclohydrolase family protein [bacterium]